MIVAFGLGAVGLTCCGLWAVFSFVVVPLFLIEKFLTAKTNGVLCCHLFSLATRSNSTNIKRVDRVYFKPTLYGNFFYRVWPCKTGSFCVVYLLCSEELLSGDFVEPPSSVCCVSVEVKLM